MVERHWYSCTDELTRPCTSLKQPDSINALRHFMPMSYSKGASYIQAGQNGAQMRALELNAFGGLCKTPALILDEGFRTELSGSLMRFCLDDWGVQIRCHL